MTFSAELLAALAAQCPALQVTVTWRTTTDRGSRGVIAMTHAVSELDAAARRVVALARNASPGDRVTVTSTLDGTERTHLDVRLVRGRTSTFGPIGLTWRPVEKGGVTVH